MQNRAKLPDIRVGNMQELVRSVVLVHERGNSVPKLGAALLDSSGKKELVRSVVLVHERGNSVPQLGIALLDSRGRMVKFEGKVVRMGLKSTLCATDARPKPWQHEKEFVEQIQAGKGMRAKTGISYIYVQPLFTDDYIPKAYNLGICAAAPHDDSLLYWQVASNTPQNQGHMLH